MKIPAFFTCINYAFPAFCLVVVLFNNIAISYEKLGIISTFLAYENKSYWLIQPPSELTESHKFSTFNRVGIYGAINDKCQAGGPLLLTGRYVSHSRIHFVPKLKIEHLKNSTSDNNLHVVSAGCSIVRYVSNTREEEAQMDLGINRSFAEDLYVVIVPDLTDGYYYIIRESCLPSGETYMQMLPEIESLTLFYGYSTQQAKSIYELELSKRLVEVIGRVDE